MRVVMTGNEFLGKYEETHYELCDGICQSFINTCKSQNPTWTHMVGSDWLSMFINDYVVVYDSNSGDVIDATNIFLQPKAVVEPEIELDSYDTLHSDGSKTYQTYYNDRILIDNPKTVLFLESVLAGEYVGWGYMEKVTDEYKSGRITQDEYSKIIKILD